ncbi:D123-domain-containing protein [Neohortaea acidophila]|uniref:D123-domain-containing protein n=1 Tax=Neohortaea acidophila TaxID=245834 RepID=A0A6A6PFZ9_9PEZI|nr:D123-domain-containing protein [Neohortaea acidophila]KAF2478875.1 D123-domain-containing protein [Neohortaea acidophila]
MPEILEEDEDIAETPTELPFPPITKQHILHCSYHSWHPKFRNITPKARLVPLSRPFLDYLRADGILLPSDEEPPPQWSDTDSGIFSASDNTDGVDDDDEGDVAAEWRGIHNAIKATIAELGGKVYPKLNWSAPKDATWMNANSMECRNPSDIYLLLKSSDFVTHDLEHAFDDTEDSTDLTLTPDSIPYHLVLRKAVPQWNPSVEFRCFVRNNRLLCICQRDLNYFDFLFKMTPNLRSLIQEFFDVRIRGTFPDENYTFDVYIPNPYNRVWLVDFNPWAPRTDPLLFSWLEILTMPEPPAVEADEGPEVVRLQMGAVPQDIREALREAASRIPDQYDGENADDDEDGSSEDDSDVDEEIWHPEFRLVRQNDPEAYAFSSTQYSAHKLPKDVVDASQNGEGLREFARDWHNILARRQREEQQAGESSEDE